MTTYVKPVEQAQPIRTVLSTGAVASVHIKTTAKPGKLPSDKTMAYLQFPYYVKGGCINVFLHSIDTSLIGQYVRARIEVCEKVFADGRAYIHVDLHPVGDNVPETNRLFFIPHTDVARQPHWQMFETSDVQGQGLIIFGTLDELYPKAIERSTAAQTPFVYEEPVSAVSPIVYEEPMAVVSPFAALRT